MIGLDSNILVRYLAQDDPVQSRKAAKIIERQLSEKNPGFISIVTIVETVWVLERAYGFEVFVIESEAEVFTATAAVKAGKGSFVDVVIAALGLRAGCSHTLTFDQKAARLPGFELA